MRIVNSEHAQTGRIVQRQRIADAMRTVRVCRYTPSHGLDPKAPTDLGDEPIEIEQPVETLISRAHLINLSQGDNMSLCISVISAD